LVTGYYSSNLEVDHKFITDKTRRPNWLASLILTMQNAAKNIRYRKCRNV